MKRLSLILLLSTCLAFPVRALEGLADAQDTGQGDKTEAATPLDLFVRDAIDEGLLRPAGDTPAEPETVSGAPVVPMAPVEARPVLEEVDCTAPYPLDFTSLREFDRYQQIYTFQERVSAMTGPGAAEARSDLARAYLALGLYSEAAMVVKSASDDEAVAFRKLAALMENRVPPDIGYFRQLADCHDEAGIWLAVALLAGDQDEGVERFSDNLNSFRKLPFRLRADISALTIPELDKRHEEILSVKLIADFTEEEIAGASQLQFAKAIVDLGHNRPDAENALRVFLNEPQFQEAALASLMRREKPLNGVHEEILLGELMKKFGQTGDDRALAASLQFALQELSGSSHYQPIMDLSAMPALQNAAAQSEIRRQFVAGLGRDLASDNRLRNLAAMNALVSDPGILKTASERSELYRSGARLAVRFGLASLARELAEKDGSDDDIAEQLASLEFLRQDYHAVYAWARNYPEKPAINLMAARGAVQSGDAGALKEFESHLSLDPDSILTLIEQDAASGQWIVSGEIYRLAGELTDAGHRQRAERVLAMRRSARSLADGREKMAMARVPDVLKQTDPSPEQVSGGAR